MPIEKAPYLRYIESVSTENYSYVSEADVLVIVAPTKFAKLTNEGTIETETVDGETTTKWYDPTVSEDEIILLNKYSLAEQFIQSEELKKDLKQFFSEDSYYTSNTGYGVGYVMLIPLPTTPTNTDLLNAYKIIRKFRKVTAIGFTGITFTPSLLVSLKQYLTEDQLDGILRIAYVKAPQRESNETITQYASKIANLNQKHTETQNVNGEDVEVVVEGANCSRIALLEPNNYGSLLAKICNTPYYLEPGYIPLNSVSVGTFELLSSEERDKLCMSGLVFGEDDMILPVTVPRICLGVSSSFGRPYSVTSQGYENRPADALLHARRNADHHIREVLGILAYQIKRNETSVTLQYVKNEVMGYFERELSKGTIQAYSFNVNESTLNPYCLQVTGSIVPVNSTMAIEFYNTIQAPYTIASNYI